MKKFMIVMKVIAALFNLAVAIFFLAAVYLPDFCEASLWALFLLLFPAISLLAIFGSKPSKVIKTIAVLTNLGGLIFLVTSLGSAPSFEDIADSTLDFFLYWGIVLYCVCNVIAIVNFDLTSRIKTLTKGNPHILAAYIFAIIITILFAILVVDQHATNRRIEINESLGR